MSASPRPPRPLLDTWSALGLIGATGAAFAALFPASQERESRALAGAPDLLSLSYLKLALARRPDDEALRVQVAERTLAAGQFDRAREILEPLIGGGSTTPGAAALRVDIDHRAWAAVDPDDGPRRSLALARLLETIERVEPELRPAHEAEAIARVCAQVGASAKRAKILEAVARAHLADDDRVRAADAAWLELNDPLASAALRAERALTLPDQSGAVNAALALRRALAAARPGSALVLFRKLRPLYGHIPRVLELGLSTLAGVDDVEALAVAERLLALRPNDGALRERIAQLRAWTGGDQSATAAPGTLAAPRPAPLRWELGEVRALPARSASDLAPLPTAARTRANDPTPSVRAEGAGGAAPLTSERAIERAALLESLGAPERALELLNAALAQQLVDERALWDLKVGLQLRLGQKREALATLVEMDARFGATCASRHRRADLLLSLGELGGALELLATAPGPRELDDVRRITAIGWELGDMTRVRAAYRTIAASEEATVDDVRRLWLLEHEGGDLAASARAALAGFERFAELDLLKLALATALEAGDGALVEKALALGEANGARLGADAESLRLHVSVRQARAHRALLHNDPARARTELGRSEHLLELAARAQLGPAAPGFAGAAAELPGTGLGDLWKAQDRQTLELALLDGDRTTLARVYPKRAESLTTRERVFVLARLGRNEEAVGEALAGIATGALPESDGGALAADADALGADMPRKVGVLADVQSMKGLTAARVGAEGRLSWSGGRTLGARLELTELGSADELAALGGQDEIAAEVGAGLASSHVTLGVVVLEGDRPRPSLRFEQGLLEGDDIDVDVSARLNERSSDAPGLRLSGVEDELAARATLAFRERFTATLHGSAKLYSDRASREPFGGGATLDAAFGREWSLPSGVTANGRFAGYIAPRFAVDGAGASELVPDGAGWIGFGAGVSRGRISVAPVTGRRLSLLADASAGWLLPRAELGWSARLGFGVSIFGADQFSILASASNVVSTVPGFAVYSLGADYEVSRW
jgi:hypothetical protein